MTYCINPDHGVADTCARCATAREAALTAQVERLTADNKKLRENLYQEERRCAALLVDADRREQRATKIAESCAEHGKEIQYLRHIASWYWAGLNQQEEARADMITSLMLTIQGLGNRTEPVPVDTLTTWLNKAVKAHDKVFRRPKGYRALADCLADGTCDHDGLTDGLAAEIAEALGLPVLLAAGPARPRAEKKGTSR